MSTKYDSAEVILKLYDMRREETMRKARQWMATFNPQSVEEIGSAVAGEHSAYLRMVTTYWDMACALVLQGAIDEEMFNETNGEHIFIYAKFEPFVEEIRAKFGPRAMMPNVEKLIMRMPDIKERLAQTREMIKRMEAMRAQQADAEASKAKEA